MDGQGELVKADAPASEVAPAAPESAAGQVQDPAIVAPPTSETAPAASSIQVVQPPQQPLPQRSGSGQHHHHHRERPSEIYQSMPIPKGRVGWIIGKQGAYIQQLEKKSGCAISVSDSPSKEYGREWNYVQLQGTTRAVDKAKKLIYLRLESFPSTPESRSYNGRQDRFSHDKKVAAAPPSSDEVVDNS